MQKIFINFAVVPVAVFAALLLYDKFRSSRTARHARTVFHGLHNDTLSTKGILWGYLKF